MTIIINDEILEFEWDSGNSHKNWIKHQVSPQEAEEVFADDDKIVYLDIKHLGKEERFLLIGKTSSNRILTIAYTRRAHLIRVISARDASRKEEDYYEKATHSTEV